ncbi:uncharacterized protein LOC117101369, partial [Anneissia japonica]|uniref:uncharacterized protein LOC117101369 n=1 Tax=Anneissia japonica TaxID=1529436 RepID=UPI0014257E84
MMATNHPSNKDSKKNLVDAMLKPPEVVTKKSSAEVDGLTIGDIYVCSKPCQGSKTIPLSDNTASVAEIDFESPKFIYETNNSSTRTSQQHSNPMTSEQDDKADALQVAPSVVNNQSSPSTMMMPTNHPSNLNSKNLKPPDSTKKSCHEGDGGTVSVLEKQNEGESLVCSNSSLSQGSKTIPFLTGTSSSSEVDHKSTSDITIGTARPQQGNNPMSSGQDDKALLNKTADASQMPPPVNSQSSL